MISWENILIEEDSFLERIKVPGGYLYRSVKFYPTNQFQQALSFIPDSPKCNICNYYNVLTCSNCNKIEPRNQP